MPTLQGAAVAVVLAVGTADVAWVEVAVELAGAGFVAEFPLLTALDVAAPLGVDAGAGDAVPGVVVAGFGAAGVAGLPATAMGATCKGATVSAAGWGGAR